MELNKENECKKIYWYFISYISWKDGIKSYKNAEVPLTCKVTSIDIINTISDELIIEHGFNDVLINNFIFLREENRYE